MSRIELLRQGFGFGGRYPGEEAAARAGVEEGERDSMLVRNPSNPQQTHAVAAAMQSEAGLQRALTEAGYL